MSRDQRADTRNLERNEITETVVVIHVSEMKLPRSSSDIELNGCIF